MAGISKGKGQMQTSRTHFGQLCGSLTSTGRGLKTQNVYNIGMKKFLTLVVVLLIVVGISPLLVSAGSLKYGENYSLRKGESIDGDLYAVGANTTIAGNVLGDLVATGMSVFVGGNEISDDVLVIADSAHIISSVKKDLRAIARKIYIGDNVGEDVAVAAGSIELLPQASVAGDLLIAAGQASIFGEVQGNLKAVVGEIFIDDIIHGDVSLVANKVVLGPNAVISGSFSYSASEPAEIQSGANIVGETTYRAINTRARAEKLLPTFWGTWFIIKFIVLMLSPLIARGILRNITSRFVVVALHHKAWSLLKGFLVFVAVPVAAFIGMLTFIAIPFSLFALALYGIGILLALVYAPIVLGSYIHKIYKRPEELVVSWKTIVTGSVALALIGLIPILGGIISYAVLLIALGGIYQVLFDKFMEVR